MEKQFTKNDLQTGHIVVTKEGEKGILIGNRFKRICHIEINSGMCGIDDYEYDLKHKGYEDCNIERVYRIVNGYGYGLSEIIDKLPSDKVELIWEREKEIDWTKVPKFTRVQVRDCNDSEWKNRYFIGYAKNNEAYPYLATWSGEFTYGDGDCSNWKKIRIYDEAEIKEEWYK